MYHKDEGNRLCHMPQCEQIIEESDNEPEVEALEANETDDVVLETPHDFDIIMLNADDDSGESEANSDVSL